MKVLVIYAHPNPKSFNHDILEKFTKGLEDAGHTFEVVDLYAIKFDPCLTLADYAQFSEGKEEMPPDVLGQQEKVSNAEALVFIYPVWWSNLPAILKGWIDRLLSCGFAYKYVENGTEGLLKHKKALLISTTYYSQKDYESWGVEKAMRTILLDSTVKGAGIENVEYVFLYQAESNKEARGKYLQEAYRLGKEF